MIASRNLSLRAPAPNLFMGIWRCIKFLAGIPTLCQHQNSHYPAVDMQRCYRCKRIRRFGSNGVPSVWHRDEVR